MKFFGLGLIFVSILFIYFNITDEIEGSVTVYSQKSAQTYTKLESPQKFRNTMIFYWISSPIPAILGCILFQFIRRQDRLDPSSPHFQGSQSLDELGEYLDQELEKKKKAEQGAETNP